MWVYEGGQRVKWEGLEFHPRHTSFSRCLSERWGRMTRFEEPILCIHLRNYLVLPRTTSIVRPPPSKIHLDPPSLLRPRARNNSSNTQNKYSRRRQPQLLQTLQHIPLAVNLSRESTRKYSSLRTSIGEYMVPDHA